MDCKLWMGTLLEQVELSVRANRICKEQGITTLEDLRQKIDDLYHIKGCGRKTIEELEEMLEKSMLAMMGINH